MNKKKTSASSPNPQLGLLGGKKNTASAPRGWETVALDEIAEIRLGRQRSPDRAHGDHMRPYMRAANVTWSGINVEDVKEMDFRPSEVITYELHDGDILLSEASGSPGEVGKPAVWRNEVPGACFQNTLIRVRAPRELVPFLHRHFLHDALTGRFSRASRGVGIHHLGAQAISSWPTLVPPLQEQDRLIEALDSYLTRLDAAAAGLKRVEANLKRYRASVLKSAVEGRLVPSEAELAKAEGRDYEPASVLLRRILDERRRRWEEAELTKMKAKGVTPKDSKWKAKYEEPAAPDTSGLTELPEGWCWATVDQLASAEPRSLTDGPFGSNLKTEHYTDSGPRVVRLQNIGEGTFVDSRAHISVEHYDTLHKHSVLAGDVLISSLGDNLPRACLVPDWLGPAIVKADCIRFAPDVAIVANGYVMWALNAEPTRKRTESVVHGVGRSRIGLTLLREVVLPVPPRDEQDRIQSQLDQISSGASAIQHAVHLDLQRVERLRQSILKWAFEGKLVDQDPNDEPASALLERIRAQRDTGAKSTAKSKSPRSRAPEPAITSSDVVGLSSK